MAPSVQHSVLPTRLVRRVSKQSQPALELETQLLPGLFGNIAVGSDVYEFTTDLGADFASPAGTTYWGSVTNDTTADSDDD